MRTIIELPDEQHARLMELAARRGEKGFSRLVQEAVALYLEREATRGARVARALALRGTLRGDEAEQLATATREARGAWR
jgi:predicted transcriptional regulator